MAAPAHEGRPLVVQPFDPDGDASDTRTLPASLVAACNVLRDLRESLMEEDDELSPPPIVDAKPAHLDALLACHAALEPLLASSGRAAALALRDAFAHDLAVLLRAVAVADTLDYAHTATLCEGVLLHLAAAAAAAATLAERAAAFAAALGLRRADVGPVTAVWNRTAALRAADARLALALDEAITAEVVSAEAPGAAAVREAALALPDNVTDALVRGAFGAGSHAAVAALGLLRDEWTEATRRLAAAGCFSALPRGLAASVGGDGLRVWRLEDGACLQHRPGAATCVADLGGGLLAAGSGVWDAVTEKDLFTGVWDEQSLLLAIPVPESPGQVLVAEAGNAAGAAARRLERVVRPPRICIASAVGRSVQFRELRSSRFPSQHAEISRGRANVVAWAWIRETSEILMSTVFPWGAAPLVGGWSLEALRVDRYETVEASRVVAFLDAPAYALAALQRRRVVAAGAGVLTVLDVDTEAVLFSSGEPDNALTGPHAVAAVGAERVAAACESQTVTIWSVWPNGRLEPDGAPLVGHTAPVTCIAPADDAGARALTASVDNTLRLWDVATRACLRVFEGHDGGVKHLVAVGALAPPAEWRVAATALAAAAKNDAPAAENKARRLRKLQAAGVAPGAVLAVALNSGQLRLLSDSSHTLSCFHGAPVTAAADLGGGFVCTGAGDTLRVWDALDGSLVLQRRAAGDEAAITCVAAAWGGRVAAGNALGGINVWRLRGGAGGEGDAPVQPPLLVPAPEPPSAVLALAALKRHGSKDVDDSACVLAGGYADGFVRVWKLKHAGVNLIAAFEAHTGGGCSLVASALTGDTAKRRLQDVLLVSGGDDGALRVWTVRLSSGAAEQLWADLYAHLGAAVTSLAWHTSHDGSTAVVSGGADGTVQLWRLHGLASAGGGLLPSGVLQDAGLERVGSLAGTGNGRIVAIAPSEARIRAASTTAVSSLLEVDTLVVSMSVTAAPPGQRIAAVAALGAAPPPRECGVTAVLEAMAAEIELELHNLSAARHRPGMLAATASADGTVAVWRLAEPARLMRVLQHTSPVNALVDLGDGRLATGDTSGELRAWDAVTGAHVFTRDAGAAHGPVYALAVLPPRAPGDAGRLASGHGTGAVLLWAAGGCPPHAPAPFHAGGGAVSALALTSGGLLATGADGAVRLWDVSHEAPACVRELAPAGRGVILAPLAGDLLLVGARDGWLRLWDAANGEEVEAVEMRGAVAALAPVAGRGGAGAAVGFAHGALRRWRVDRETRALEAAAGGSGSAAPHTALAAWTDRVLAGGGDGTVWLHAPGVCERLGAHELAVTAALLLGAAAPPAKWRVAEAVAAVAAGNAESETRRLQLSERLESWRPAQAQAGPA